MIRARGLVVQYGGKTALQGVSLDVNAAETVALVGPNGAGKSTLLQVLAGTLRANQGEADVAGHRLPGDEAKLGRSVGYVPQGESVYPELTVRENLRFFARLHGVPHAALAERAARLVAEMGLQGREHQRAGTLSGGLRQRLAIACSLMHDPKVLLLDEPATGLDPLVRERLLATLRALRGRDRAILFSTHDFGEAARVADRVALLVDGRLVAVRPAAEAPKLEAMLRAAEVGA